MGTNSLGGVGGFNSGLDVNSIISQLIAVESRPIDLMNTKKATLSKQQAAYSTIKLKANTFYAAVKQLTQRDVATQKTIFDNMAVSSSDSKAVSATVANTASPQSLSIEVLNLASSTTATSKAGISNFGNSTTLADLGITDGKFTLTTQVGTVAKTYEITVSTSDQIQDVLTDIASAISTDIPGTTVSIQDGKIQVNRGAGGAGTSVSFGAGGDTSNFLSKTYLNTAIPVDDGTTHTTTSSQRINTFRPDVSIAGGGANLGTPITLNDTFEINGVSFSVKDPTTGNDRSLYSIIDEINKSNAGVTASFNKGTGTFQLVSKNTGSNLISLKDTSGSFLQAMKLVDGTDTVSSQTVGSNTRFKINGQEMYATGTNITEETTGFTGITLDLKKAQPGTTIQIDVQKDVDSIVKQVQTIVKSFNELITEIDKQTKADPEANKSGATSNSGPLVGDNNIKSFRNQLRSMFSQSVGGLVGTAYDSLQSVGISSFNKDFSAASTTTTTEDSTDDPPAANTPSSSSSSSTSGGSIAISVNAAKLKAALVANPEAIKKLFIGQDLPPGASGVDDGMDGTFTKLFRAVTDTTYKTSTGQTAFGALYLGGAGSQGLFGNYNESMGKRIKQITDSISKAQDRLTIREKTLRQQYLAMDKLVGQYQQQATALNSLPKPISS